MSEINAVKNSFAKLKNNQFDVTLLDAEQLDILKEYAPSLINASVKLVQAGSKVQKKVLKTIDKAIDSYAKQLEDKNLSPEVRADLNDRIEKMVEKALVKDTEYKQWMGYLAIVAVGGLVVAKNPELLKKINL